MPNTIAILATLDTKGVEVAFLKNEIEAAGAQALLIDIGVVGEPAAEPDITRVDVIEAAGMAADALLANPTREDASPILIRGATKILLERVKAGTVHAILSLGGTQGTSNCSQVMQALPYGFPKIMVSTVASGDTAPFVGIKDITMMFSVSDVLGLNTFSRKILANAAGAAVGMANVEREIDSTAETGKPLIGMTNLGVLTDGAMHAIDRFHAKGYEVIPFHAVGSGGLAMEQMMKDGIIGAVLDYALGEISDEVFDGLRAANEERLTVAAGLGLPQVVCPGGAEHIGLLLDTPNEVPERYKNHKYVFHNPIIFAPRLNAEELESVADTICSRLARAGANTKFLIPTRGVSRYSVEGGELRDETGDTAFFDALKSGLPETVEVREIDAGAEDDTFVDAAVDALIDLIESK